MNHSIEIIEVVDPVNINDFSVRKFIKMGDNHYLEIQPKQIAYRIRISPSDYHKALHAYYDSKAINCYPIAGDHENGTFEEVIYEMIIK